MERKHLFTATSPSGWHTGITIKSSGRIEMYDGRSVITLSIKDIRKIVREYNKVIKEVQ